MITKTAMCPKCGSKDILKWSDGRSGAIYTCKYCGYKGQDVLAKFKHK